MAAEEVGATEHQFMALFGWSSMKQAGIYTKKASRTKLEAEAAPLLHGRKGNESVLPFPVVASGGTKEGEKVPRFQRCFWGVVPRGGIEPPTP